MVACHNHSLAKLQEHEMATDLHFAVQCLSRIFVFNLRKGLIGIRGLPLFLQFCPREHAMRLNRHLSLSLLAVFLCSTLPALGAGFTQGAPVSCLDKSKLSSKPNPSDLWKSIASCISSESYDEAVFMYAMAGTFGRFDTLRVADKSAHQATKVLPMLAFGTLQKDKVAAFQARVQQILGNDSIRATYCAEIESFGPPNYFPSYMLQHGLGATSDSNNSQPFVVPFDPKAAWPKAVKEYLQCPSA